MDHVSDSVLGALRSGGAVSRRDYAHVDRCLACRRSLGSVMPPQPPSPSRRRAVIAAAATAALVGSVFAIEPLRAAAFGFVEVFEPQHVVLIPMTVNDFKEMSSLPDFNEFGTTRELLASKSLTVSDLRSAQAVSRFRLRLPAAASPAATEFRIETPSLQEFAFSDAMAKSTATSENKPYVPMPAGMDGSVMRIAFGGMVTATFTGASSNGYVTGDTPVGVRRQPVRTFGARVPARNDEAGATEVHGFAIGGTWGPRHAMTDAQRLAGVGLIQMPLPKVGSTGVSVAALERYIVDRPGVSPRLAAAFASLRDPSTTLPIPVPVDRAFAQQIAVDGTVGTLIGDDTGMGSAIFWQRDGMLYAVGGMRSASDLVAIANTLR